MTLALFSLVKKISLPLISATSDLLLGSKCCVICNVSISSSISLCDTVYFVNYLALCGWLSLKKVH